MNRALGHNFESLRDSREKNVFVSLKLEDQSGVRARDLPTFQAGSF